MRTVYQYSLSIPGNLTTATYNNKQFAINAQDTFPQAVTLNRQKLKCGLSDHQVTEYISIPYPQEAISQLPYMTGISYSFVGLLTNPTDIKFNDDLLQCMSQGSITTGYTSLQWHRQSQSPYHSMR